jgi:geranylgeranyl pyrophosphate synthase
MNDAAEIITIAKLTVDAELDRLVPPADAEPRRLHEAIRWSLFAGGKRVRPAICLATGGVFGAGARQISRTAAAIEMIHTYSLIHDDLPAMDDDDLRRGKPTCHRQFDEATAILAGDVLQSLAFGAIAGDDELSPTTRSEIISLLAAACGTPDGMVAGQQMDLEAEGVDLTLEEVEQIHRRKTGALITASALCGALIGEAAPDETEAIRLYSAHLGLLFQITDDLLDVTGETASLGKTAGKDATAVKATYPRLLGIDRASQLARDTHHAAVAELDILERDTGVLSGIADMVLNRTQ